MAVSTTLREIAQQIVTTRFRRHKGARTGVVWQLRVVDQVQLVGTYTRLFDPGEVAQVVVGVAPGPVRHGGVQRGVQAEVAVGIRMHEVRHHGKAAAVDVLFAGVMKMKLLQRIGLIADMERAAGRKVAAGPICLGVGVAIRSQRTVDSRGDEAH